MTEDELTQAEFALEEESVSLGAARYNKMLAARDTAETGPGRKLVLAAINDVAQAIEGFVRAADTGKPGKRHAALKYIKEVEPHALAYLTCTNCVNALREQMTAVKLSLDIGDDVAREITYSGLKKGHPGLHRLVQRQIKRSTSPRHSEAVMNAAVREAEGDGGLILPRKDALLLGMKLLELFIEATGMVEFVTDRIGKKTVLRVQGNQKLIDWLDRAHASAAMFHPVLFPMVVPPRPWTTPRDGGYLTDVGGRADLVRTRNRAYKRELALVDMPAVYSAVNAIQATAWKINTSILDVAKELWDAGGAVAGLPDRELLELPTRPPLLETDPDYYKEHFADEFRAWKKKRSTVYEANARLVSQRLATAQMLSLADRFAEYPALYFPHNLDFRGRTYPLPPILNPQANDLGKALLTFSEGKPLGEEGVLWLAIHLANCWGVDKVSFEERIAWVQANEEMILDCALNPLDGCRKWQEADSPFCALAACFEWLGYKMNGVDHVSHIPVALDGSCNGLQNFSAMLRDPIGGAATNLIPHEKPADIYTEVLNVAQVKIAAAALQGDANAIKLDGQLTRSLVKHPVMTLPYGVTKSGMRDQLLAEMKDSTLGDDWGLAAYLAGVLWESIGEVVVAARQAMDWLRDVSKVASAAGLPVSWTTPAGFPVLQEYREPEGVRIQPHVGGRELNLVVTIGGTKIDRRRQTLGISPNFVHSCDASHMMLSVNLAVANDITAFAMIHDSYGTHAANAGVLAAALRQAFVDMYSTDVLGAFRDELQAQLPDDADPLPQLPQMGTLDLNAVLDSRYFFA